MSARVLWYLGIGYPSPCKRHVHPENARMGLSAIAAYSLASEIRQPGVLAQLEARVIWDHEAAGSIPAYPTISQSHVWCMARGLALPGRPDPDNYYLFLFYPHPERAPAGSESRPRRTL